MLMEWITQKQLAKIANFWRTNALAHYKALTLGQESTNYKPPTSRRILILYVSLIGKIYLSAHDVHFGKTSRIEFDLTAFYRHVSQLHFLHFISCIVESLTAWVAYELSSRSWSLWKESLYIAQSNPKYVPLAISNPFRQQTLASPLTRFLLA